MILEGIVTTLSLEARSTSPRWDHRIDPDLSMARFVLRPFRSSTTYQNLKARGEGVFHVTDDVLLMAQTAIGAAPAPAPATRAADVIAGQILTDACRYYEFRVVELDDREERTDDCCRDGRLRGVSATFSGSTGRNMPWSRRRFSRREQTGFRSTRCSPSSANWPL